MTAKGKINASNVNDTHRVIVKVSADGTVRPSDTKTGDGVQVARVTGKDFRAAGRYEARGKYIVHTSAGSFEAAPIQTMWLAPEDNAGIKRAHVEALEAEEARTVAEAVELAEIVAEEIKAADEAGAISTQEFRSLTRIHDAAVRCTRRSFGRPTVGRLALCHLANIRKELGSIQKGKAEAWLAQTEQVEAWLAGHRAKGTPRTQWSEIEDGRQADHAEAIDMNAERDGFDQLRSWVARHDLLSGRPEHVLPAIEADHAEALTLDSQACKVVPISSEDNNQEDDMTATDTQTETTPAEQHTGSSVVKLIERVWDRLRADHPELPEVVVTTGSGEGVKWGHFRPNSWKLEDEKRHEFFLASEALAKGAHQVLQTTLHEAAHTISKARGIQDTSRQGRWHNAAFRKAAEEMGLEHKGTTADKSHGFSFVTLTEATKDRYADVLAELDRELKLTGLLPIWMGGQDKGDEDERGGEKITGKPTKGGSEGGSTSGNLKAVCDCSEPNIIRISRKVLDLGVVKCTDCDEMFRAA